MKISIVTVVLNREKVIERSIKSVFSQTYHDIEYIVVDGESSDGTLKILNKYKKKIDILISEKDRGIYDAMNKGVKLATGDLVYFLNSDDALYDIYVMEKVAEKYKEGGYDYIYGGVICRNIFNSGQDNILLKEISETSIKMGQNIPHQSLFVKREVFDEIGVFKSNLKVNADYDFECRLVRASKKGVFIKYLISYYSQDGYSSKGGFDLYKEKTLVINENFGFLYAFPYLLFGVVKYSVVYLLRKLGIAGLVSNMMNKIRGSVLKN